MEFVCRCGHRRSEHAGSGDGPCHPTCSTDRCNCSGFQAQAEDEERFRLFHAVEDCLRATNGQSSPPYTHQLIGYLAPLAEVIVQEAVRRMQQQEREGV